MPKMSVDEIIISFDETHHLLNNRPLYPIRYKRVMSFHDGIASVENNHVAFFINTKGEKLFDRTFKKTYGFYEGLATVKDNEGFFHIDKNGRDIYKNRFDWAGNFQENKCVVKNNNKYFHIDCNGKNIYKEKWNYTGDYKYGIAVIYNDDFLATHIDTKGKFIHNYFFLELSVFHKGIAIAKDNKGYFHIDKRGNSLYKDRYKRIEPFYNGMSFGTTFTNKKILIQQSNLLIK